MGWTKNLEKLVIINGKIGKNRGGVKKCREKDLTIFTIKMRLLDGDCEKIEV
jgi:hypothetical protein